jgi:hypothetical protein
MKIILKAFIYIFFINLENLIIYHPAQTVARDVKTVTDKPSASTSCENPKQRTVRGILDIVRRLYF